MSQPDNDQSVEEQLEKILLDYALPVYQSGSGIIDMDEAVSKLKALLLDARFDELDTIVSLYALSDQDYGHVISERSKDLTNQKNKLQQPRQEEMRG